MVVTNNKSLITFPIKVPTHGILIFKLTREPLSHICGQREAVCLVAKRPREQEQHKVEDLSLYFRFSVLHLSSLTLLTYFPYTTPHKEKRALVCEKWKCLFRDFTAIQSAAQSSTCLFEWKWNAKGLGSTQRQTGRGERNNAHKNGQRIMEILLFLTSSQTGRSLFLPKGTKQNKGCRYDMWYDDIKNNDF